MKRFFCLLLASVLLIPSAVLADVDLSGMSFDELVALRNQVTTALFYSDDWKEIFVPGGFYQVGNGIPAGHWTITPYGESFISVWYGDVANASLTGAGFGWDGVNGWAGTLSTKKNKDGSWKDPGEHHSIDILLSDGWYLSFAGDVIFTPYVGVSNIKYN